MEWPNVLNSPILSGPVCLGIIVKYGVFRLFRSEEAGFSLQPRLCGGERWIRTLGTTLKCISADVCVRYTESRRWSENRPSPGAIRTLKPVRFLVPSQGRSGNDCVAESGHREVAHAPNGLARDCMPGVQSAIGKISPGMHAANIMNCAIFL